MIPSDHYDKQSHAVAWWALACVCACLLWQASLVEFKFDGNWSGLFLTSDRRPTPSLLAREKIFQVEGSDGYDGQFYHYVAHDPLLLRGLSSSVDAPALRWRRILVPGMAAILALGQDGWVDVAYRATILVFVFLGCFWLGRIAEHFRRSSLWGLCFMLIPPMSFALDRMTVDIALVALCAGYVLYSLEGRTKLVCAVLILAPLARETGLALILVHAANALLQSRWSEVGKSLACAVPFAAWVFYVGAQTDAVVGVQGWIGLPLQGLFDQTLHLVNLHLSGGGDFYTERLMGPTLLAVWMALLAATVWGWQQVKRRGVTELGPLGLGVMAFAAAAALLNSPYMWVDAHAFVRVLSPLFLFLTIASLRARQHWLLAPSVILLHWLAIETGPQALIVWRGISAGWAPGSA